MATNNATNTSNPITVAQGGTGNSSFTAYSPLAAGTTSTNHFQSIGTSASGSVLTSNGAGSLPSWQSTGGTSYALNLTTSGPGSPSDATTYYMSANTIITGSTASGPAIQKLVVPKNSTITAATGLFKIAATLGSAQNLTLNIRLNNTTNITVSSTVQLTSASVVATNSSLSQAVNAGDYLEFVIICPTWTTNPTNVSFTGSIFLS